MKISALIFAILFSINLLAQCEDFVITVTAIPPSCYGFCDGAVFVEVDGGTPPYTVIKTDENGDILSAVMEDYILCPGWYFIEAFDDAGCVLYDSIEVTETEILNPTISITNPTSTGSCDGRISIDTVTGYWGAYENLIFIWEPDGPMGAAETNWSGLCDGEYSVTIVDEWGCERTIDTAVGSLKISEPLYSFQLYPNPSNGHLFIKTSEILPTITLSDASGKFLCNPIYKSNGNGILFLDLTAYPAGTYLLQINNKVERIILK